eukprot:jgi/Botrbrau1/8810/Bobra.0330s0040.1
MMELDFKNAPCSPGCCEKMGRHRCKVGSTAIDSLLRGRTADGADWWKLQVKPQRRKTQLCMQLILNVQRPVHAGGLGGGALYIYSEGEPPWKRFRELAELRKAEYVGSGAPTDNIFVERDVRSGKDLLCCLHRCEGLLHRQRNPPVKLIVIDSIAYIFRSGSPCSLCPRLLTQSHCSPATGVLTSSGQGPPDLLRLKPCLNLQSFTGLCVCVCVCVCGVCVCVCVCGVWCVCVCVCCV